MAPLLNAMGIVASDMARSLDFYPSTRPRRTRHARRGTRQHPPSQRLSADARLRRRDKEVPPRLDTPPRHQFSLAVQCDRPAEVDKLYSQMISAGYQGDKDPWDAFWGQRYAQLRDPDGVPVDLYATL
jgi:uncharacterized glyoxalase superfamily protein PhnB